MIQVTDRHVTFTPPTGATYLMGDFTDWDERPISIGGPLTLEFPHGAYVEYAFLDADGRPIADLGNPARPRHPWYDYHRSLTLAGNNYRAPARRESLRGAVTEHMIESSDRGYRRSYVVYEPPEPARSTLYVMDGGEYYRRLAFQHVADALTAAHRMTALRMVFVEPIDRKEEYWLSEPYEEFMLTKLVPHAEHDRPATPERAIWGASLGGLFASWVAWRHPDVFNKVGTQSGCFTAAPRAGRINASYYQDPEWLTSIVASGPAKPLRFYIDTGQIEWLLGPNRRFAAALADGGYPHRYEEHPSGHNWTTWEQGLEAGLLYLFCGHGS